MDSSSTERPSIPLEAAERIIMRWDSTASEEAREKMIFDGDRNEVDSYLEAVDEIQRSMSSASLSDEQSKVNSAIQIAMARLFLFLAGALIAFLIVYSFSDYVTHQPQDPNFTSHLTDLDNTLIPKPSPPGPPNRVSAD